MRGSDQHSSLLRQRAAFAIAVLTAGFLASYLVAMAQDQSAATPKDVIFARKMLMASIGDNADQIVSMIAQRHIEVHDVHEYARNISVMLTVFPHLFPPSSNQWKEGADLDPVTDTIASPDIWTDFSDFYELSSRTAKIADEMTHATDEDEVKNLYRALGINCDLCHALYLKE